MARKRDSSKRQAILLASKGLFARKGYHATSISDIRRESGLSTGTIYNYFSSKEDIVTSIIDEGWKETLEEILPALESIGDLSKQADYLSFDLLPRLFRDEDLIHILLSEAVELSGINEKLQTLVDMVLKLRRNTGLESPEGSRSADASGGQSKLRTAITIYFLGILDAVRMSRRTDLGISQGDVLVFIRDMIIRDLSPSSSSAK